MLAEKNLSKPLLSFIILLTIILGVILMLYPPALFPDPSWGLQVLRSMQKGGGFNMLPVPDTNDISKSSAEFLSWWSPGQYLVPYLFIALFKLSVGRALALTVTLCSLTGLAGFYVCFKKLGFSPVIIALSIAFIACQQAYIIPYSFYNGGEILLFAFAGWFLYGCAYFNKASKWMAVFIFFSGITGFFCKSSFLWIYFSGLLYLWIRVSNSKKLAVWLINALITGVPAVISLVIIYIGYLSRGSNPASSNLGLKLAWETFCFPLASPLLAGFSVDDLTNGILSKPVIWLIMMALASIALISYLYRSILYTNYKLLLILIYIVAVAFFGINFLRQANISYEARHMRIVGLITTPGIIYLVGKSSAYYRVIFLAVWLYIACMNIKTEITAYKRNKYYSAHARSGVSQIFIDQPTLNYLTALDQHEHNAIFVFISPDIGLEIIRNRIITFNPLDNNLKAENDNNTYYGHGGPIHLVLPATYIGAKATAYFHCFPGYKNFTPKVLSKNYIIYNAQ